MSGIVTIFGYRPYAPEIDPSELVAIRDSMASRGPESAGAWYAPDRRIALGHRHLAVGPEIAPRPFLSGHYVVNLDGEIYNYAELRAVLEREGIEFETDCPDEILPHLFARRGLDMLQMLRGMFAFTLVDLRSRRMLLARDPFGAKPLYLSDDGQTLRIASQTSALVAGGRVSNRIDPAGAAGFFLFGSVPDPFTIRRDISAVPAGHLVWVDETGPSHPRRYFSLAEEFGHAHWRAVRTFEQDAAAEELRHAMRESVRQHMIGSVPTAVFVSAGVASAAIAAYASTSGSPLRTLTLAFAGHRDRHFEGSAHGEEVSRRFGTEHSTHMITRRELCDELPHFLAAMDQPTVGGIESYFVARVASQLGIRVALSGVGGDEFLGTDASFRWVPLLVAGAWLPSRIPRLRVAFGKMADALFPARPKLAGMLEYGGSYAGSYLLRRALFMPWELDSILGPDVAAEGLERLDPLRIIEEHLDPDPGTAYGRVATLEASLNLCNRRLREIDWSSMAHSVEVRLPLVDAVLFRRLAPLLLATRSGVKQLFDLTFSPPLYTDLPWMRRRASLLPFDEWIPTIGPPAEPWLRRWARTVWAEFAK